MVMPREEVVVGIMLMLAVHLPSDQNIFFVNISHLPDAVVKSFMPASLYALPRSP